MLILGSKSPRRKEILSLVGLDFKVIIKEVEEDIVCDNYLDYPKLTAIKKAMALIDEVNPDDIILCCDTIVHIGNEILGKPHNKEEAFQMIKNISGNTHEVVTGVFLGNKDEQVTYSVLTKVTVSTLTDQEIIDYINTSEPYDKAGGYAIQGLFGKYIEKIDGDYYNVVGLPISSIYKYLKLLKNYKEQK